MMKIKEGDYVRTKDDGIQMIWQIFQKTKKYMRSSYDKYGYIAEISDLKDDIIGKPTSNILDLLEPMDLLYIDISPDDCGGIVVPRIPETLDELKKFKKKIKKGEYELIGVLTHEEIMDRTYWKEGTLEWQD